MSLGSKLKDFFNGTEDVQALKKTTLETIQDAKNLLEQVRNKRIADGAPGVFSVLDQTVSWVDVLQKDMEIIKADKLRNIAHEIAAIKIQLQVISKEIAEAKDKQVAPKVKKTKEIKDGNK